METPDELQMDSRLTPDQLQMDGLQMEFKNGVLIDST